MKEITTGKGTFIFVPVQEGSKEHKMSSDHIGYSWLEYPNRHGCVKIPLPLGKRRFIGIYPGMGESEAREVVDWMEGKSTEGESTFLFDDYTINDFLTSCKSTALESIHTLLEANKIYLVNPYGEEPPQYANYSMYGKMAKLIWTDNVDKWKIAQSNVSPLWAVIKKEN